MLAEAAEANRPAWAEALSEAASAMATAWVPESDPQRKAEVVAASSTRRLEVAS